MNFLIKLYKDSKESLIYDRLLGSLSPAFTNRILICRTSF